jgi:hypothetical protein
MVKTVQFIAVIFTALALACAPLVTLPILLYTPLQVTYYVVYRGWTQPGVLLIGTLISNAALAILVRDRLMPFWFASIGFLAIAAALVIYFLWIDPANHSGNWTALATLNAILTFIGLCAVTCSILFYRD